MRVDPVHDILEFQSRLTEIGATSIIDSFDVQFDIPMNQHIAIHSLGMLRAFDPPGTHASFVEKAIFVGAHWCQIVYHDVNCEYGHAIDAVYRSADAAAELEQSLDDDTLPEEDRVFAAYVSARWRDGTGKIHFRSKDFVDAQLHFQKAFNLVNCFGLERCRADIQSNLLRTEFEINSELKPPNMRSTAEIVEDLKLAAEEADSTTLAENERIESRRGLAGLLQNQGALLNRLKNSDAKNLADLSNKIAEEIGDYYRIAQAKFTQANAIFAPYRDNKLASNEDELNAAVELYTDVVESRGGERSKRFARQNIGLVEAKRNQQDKALRIWLDVLTELQETNKESGEIGFDLDVQAWTVEFIATHCSIPAKDLEQLQLKVARGGRKIVKAAKYKRDYSKQVLPIYEKLFRETKQSDEHRLMLVEEVSGRELLDVLGQSYEQSR